MTTIEERIKKESEVVVSNYWGDDLLWYMQKYSSVLGHEKIADIFINSLTVYAKQMAQDLGE